MAVLSGVLRQCISWNVDRFCRVHNRDDDVNKLYFLMWANIAMNDEPQLSVHAKSGRTERLLRCDLKRK